MEAATGNTHLHGEAGKISPHIGLNEVAAELDLIFGALSRTKLPCLQRDLVATPVNLCVEVSSSQCLLGHSLTTDTNAQENTGE